MQPRRTTTVGQANGHPQRQWDGLCTPRTDCATGSRAVVVVVVAVASAEGADYFYRGIISAGEADFSRVIISAGGADFSRVIISSGGAEFSRGIIGAANAGHSSGISAGRVSTLALMLAAASSGERLAMGGSLALS